jgi:hypothetical protein
MEYGFFAHMTHCLYIFTYCEQRGFVPEIQFTSRNYRDFYKGPNWLDHYFCQTRKTTATGEIAHKIRQTKKIRETEDMEHLFQIEMSIEGGSRTLQKYLRLKPHITQKVEDFWTALGTEGPIIGIHFRGTDKSGEAPRVPWEHCLTVVEDYISNHETQAIFVASDEREFIDFIKISIKDLPVYCNDDHYRSQNSQPIHTDPKGGGYEKGEDALVNVLLLAKCSALVRTTSTFSAWASIFNPKLRVILLNKPYPNNLWFPESEILRQPDTKLIPVGDRAGNTQRRD